MENPKLVAITNKMRAYIGDDGRMVELVRFEEGGFRFEWQRPEGGGSAAMLSTKVQLTEASFVATAQLVAKMVAVLSGHDDEDGELPAPCPADELEELRRDAERYRTWRDAACYRTVECAKALCEATTPAQLDAAIDRLS